MTALTLDIAGAHCVSALWSCPSTAAAAYVFAHGAGAGMQHAFMAAMSDALFARNVATLRFNFPFMESGSKRPDRPALAQETIRAAVAKAADLVPTLPLFAGGKSFGGRMTSQAQAEDPLPNVRGLVFIGFPLHPAKKPSVDRANHLADVGVPMLFVQGTRDALAEMSLIEATVARLGSRATLHVVDAADHAFHVPAKSGRTDADVIGAIADDVAGWCKTNAQPGAFTA